MSACCCLAPPTPDDWGGLIRLHVEPEARAFLGGAVSHEEARRRVTVLFEDHHPGLAWAIRAKDLAEEVCVGLVTLDPHHDGQDMQISYLLLPEYWGCGYASHAIVVALEHAFTVLGLTRVLAETQSKNIRSIRLLERVGMQFERRVIRFGEEQCIYAISAAGVNPRIHSKPGLSTKPCGT